jgi:hypothetical protein
VARCNVHLIGIRSGRSCGAPKRRHQLARDLRKSSAECQVRRQPRHCPVFLLKVGLKVLRVTTNSSGVSLFTRQDETTEDLFAVRRVNAARETAEVAAQVTEEALGQVGGAQAMPPACWPTQVGEHPMQFGLELLHHLRRPEPPATAETGRPAAQLPLVLGFPDPPEFAPELASPRCSMRDCLR